LPREQNSMMIRRHITVNFIRSLLVLAFLCSLFCARPTLTHGQVSLLPSGQSKEASGSLSLYRTEQQAHNHCPSFRYRGLAH
jgi:hypothetical protein